MENKFLIDLSIKYGLNSEDVSKTVDILYQAGLTDLESREFQRAAHYICQARLIDTPSEEIVEELRRKELIPDNDF